MIEGLDSGKIPISGYEHLPAMLFTRA